MRAIFGVLSLLIVLAIVGSLAKKQLGVIGPSSVASRSAEAASQVRAQTGEPDPRAGSTVAIPGGMPGAMAADVSGLSVPQQSKAMQDKIRDDTMRAMQQGADRSQRASDTP